MDDVEQLEGDVFLVFVRRLSTEQLEPQRRFVRRNASSFSLPKQGEQHVARSVRRDGRLELQHPLGRSARPLRRARGANLGGSSQTTSTTWETAY